MLPTLQNRRQFRLFNVIHKESAEEACRSVHVRIRKHLADARLMDNSSTQLHAEHDGLSLCSLASPRLTIAGYVFCNSSKNSPQSKRRSPFYDQ